MQPGISSSFPTTSWDFVSISITHNSRTSQQGSSTDHLLPRCSENIAGLELVFLSFLSRKDNLEELVPDPLDPNLQGRIWEAEHMARTPMMLVPQQARDVRPGCCLHAADEPKHGPCITWLGSSMDESL